MITNRAINQNYSEPVNITFTSENQQEIGICLTVMTMQSTVADKAQLIQGNYNLKETVA